MGQNLFFQFSQKRDFAVVSLSIVHAPYAQIAREGIETITEEEEEPTVEIPSEELNKLNQDWNRIIPEEPLSTSPEPESPAESSSSVQNRTPLHPPPQQRKLLAVMDHIKMFPRLRMDQIPNMICGCNPKQLKDAFKSHKATFTSTMRMPYHCCLCHRPGHHGNIAYGNETYYQWCRACERAETYNIEDAIWWHKPCCTCLAPIKQRENVEWDVDACSKACKYAYLAVASAKHFTHIPTLIKKYKFSKNCRDLYLDVAYRAERLWIRKYPYEERDYYHTKYHNQLSWMDMAWEFAEEVNYFSPNMPPTIEAISTEEAIALRSFNKYEAQNEVILMERFKRMCNLQEDKRLGGRIKLCEECLMPFTIEELKKKDGRWLCIETESNRDPCEPGNSSTMGRNSTSTSSSQQPEPGSWSEIFQQIGNQPE